MADVANDQTPEASEDPPQDPSSPRARALEILDAVLHKNRTLDDVLAEPVQLAAFERRDRGFIRLLVATTLRRLGQIDALIDHCLHKPLPPGARPVRDVLRLGVAQLVFLNIPPHAAVDQSVELASGLGHSRFKSLVNAVLRRLTAEGQSLAAQQNAPRVNTPGWLWRSWADAYGEDRADAIAEANGREASLDITVSRDPQDWGRRLGATVLPTGSLRRPPGGAVEELAGFGEGAWWVQDAAAALPARLLGDVADRSVIDLCAAPGGKTAQLVAAGARVTAVDRSAPRLRRLADNMSRLGLPVEQVAADAALWKPKSPADAVLLDAPCTATGTIRRHPDILWSKSPRDLERLSHVQERLLRAAINMVRPGGRLVYCTCSLQPEEGPMRIEALLAEGAPVEREPIDPAEIGGEAEFVTSQGELRTLPSQWPDLGGIDGFYAVRLRRL